MRPRCIPPAGRWKQVLLNLVVNASEAMHGEAALKIVLRPCRELPIGFYILRPAEAGGYVQIHVVDTGAGHRTGNPRPCVEPFFTTKRSAARRGPAWGFRWCIQSAQQTGIGLSLESDPGKGASFTLTIPVTDATVRQTHQYPNQQPGLTSNE